MKKVLYVSNILAHINSFHNPYIEMLRKNGYEVDILTNADGKMKPACCCELFDVKIERSPFKLQNISALKQAKEIIRKDRYDLIHVHTPMGGVIGRLAAQRARKSGSKVIYTSHGFHFYRGASILNWLLYYPMEKLLTRLTDCIITINEEDHERAKKLSGGRCIIEKMEGVGVDTKKFHPVESSIKTRLKQEYGHNNKLIVFYAAEFIERKNHQFLIENFSKVAKQIPDVCLLLAGVGKLQSKMKSLVRSLGTEDSVIFLDYRKDIPKLLSMTDLNISTSNQEGFPINVVEGVAAGCPELVSRIRGNIDIVKDGHNGFTYTPGNCEEFVEKLVTLLNDGSLRARMSLACQELSDKISTETLVPQMAKIYSKVLEAEIMV